MKKLIILGVLASAIAGCSQVTKQENTQSNLPTAETLISQCVAGKAQTPPVRVGACDDYNLIASGCITASGFAQGAPQACQANGYNTDASKGFVRQ